MNDLTRRQLRAISLAFYEAQAEAFDASRVDLPWPGWEHLFALLSDEVGGVLDIGCGNGRFAAALAATGRRFDYVGTDASEGLLAAAANRVGTEIGGRPAEWILQDFLESVAPGEALPNGPYSLVALMGVLHHVPSAEARLDLLRAVASRIEPGGLLALTSWQFARRERFERRRVPWAEMGPVLGEVIGHEELEPGDWLLRFGNDPSAVPRYCHQVSPEEFETWPSALGLETVADFRADGAQGDLNRHWIARQSA